MGASSASMRAIAWSTRSAAETWRAASAATRSVVLRYVIFPFFLWLLASTDRSSTRAPDIDATPATIAAPAATMRSPRLKTCPKPSPVPTPATLPYPAASVQAGQPWLTPHHNRYDLGVGMCTSDIISRMSYPLTVPPRWWPHGQSLRVG